VGIIIIPTKTKAVPLHTTKAQGERRYSYYSFKTSALDGGQWSASRPGCALASGKGPPVPIVQKAGWPPEPVWTQGLQENDAKLLNKIRHEKGKEEKRFKITQKTTTKYGLYLHILVMK
jgi:hypothetical protein